MGCIVAIVAGTKAEAVIEVLCKIPKPLRKKVTEIALDMAGSMSGTPPRHDHQVMFPRAVRVTDRFHVQRLAIEALQEIRIKYRWAALDLENDAIEQTKASQAEYQPEMLPNGDIIKQLLARARYALYKEPNTWTGSQKERAQLLFKRFLDLKRAYELSLELSNIFTNTTEKIYALTRLAKWHEKSGNPASNHSTLSPVRSRTTINPSLTILTTETRIPQPNLLTLRSRHLGLSSEVFGTSSSSFIDLPSYMLNSSCSTTLDLIPGPDREVKRGCLSRRRQGCSHPGKNRL